MIYLQLGAYAQRMFDPINAGAQMQCFLADPMRFVRALGRAVAANGWMYVEQIAGRTGADSLMSVPALVVIVELALLAAVGLAAAARRRALTAGIVILSVIGIFFSQYLVWSVACGEQIEGVQGRYFLPLLTLALTLPAVPRLRPPRIGPPHGMNTRPRAAPSRKPPPRSPTRYRVMNASGRSTHSPSRGTISVSASSPSSTAPIWIWCCVPIPSSPQSHAPASRNAVNVVTSPAAIA